MTKSALVMHRFFGYRTVRILSAPLWVRFLSFLPAFVFLNLDVRAQVMNQPGTIDLSFAPQLEGSLYGGPSDLNAVMAIAVQSDDKIVVGGDFAKVNGESRQALVRLNPDGTVDHTFLNGQSGPNSAVQSIILQPNEKILIGGEFGFVNGVSRNGIARLNSDGTLDDSFQGGQSGDGTYGGTVYSITLQADQKIVIAGHLTSSIDGRTYYAVARLNQDGTLDSGFRCSLTNLFIPPPPFPINYVPVVVATAVQTDGRILIGGSFQKFTDGPGPKNIARLNTNGSLDTTFLSGKPGITNTVRSVVLQSNGQILVGGTFLESVNGQAASSILRLNPSGVLDSAFAGSMPNSEVATIAVQPDGKIVVGGSFWGTVNGQSRKGIARLSNDGSLDTTFAAGGEGTNNRVNAVAFQRDGKILIGGYLSYQGTSIQNIARLYGWNPPRITTEPLDYATTAGGVAIFAIAADGDQPLSYQWHRDGIPLLGQTNQTLSLTDLQYNGGYSVRVSNTGGQATSRVASLTVTHVSGDELKPPQGAVLNNLSPAGPAFSPTNAAFWDATNRKLYSVNPSNDTISIMVTWRDTAGDPIQVSALIQGQPAQSYELGREIPNPPLADSSQLPATGPTVNPSGATFWHEPTKRLYATAPAACTITWRNSFGTPIPVHAVNSWPTNEALYQVHVGGSPAVALTNAGVFSSTRLLYQDSGVGADALEVESSRRFITTGPGRSLLLLSPGNPQETNIYFQFVKTVRWDNPAYLLETNTVIGEAILPPALHDPTAGAPWVQNSLSQYCVETSYWSPTNRLAPIIPVNKDSPTTSDDDLVVTYYQKGTKLVDAATGNTVSTTIGWPYQAVRYQSGWPTNAPVVTIAGGQGTGPINTNDFRNWKLYVQNDPTLPGFNPNDEHAIVQLAQGGTGLSVFPLRDDLGTPETSEPYVLITYQDGLDGNKPKVKVFKVEAGLFQYAGTAGNLLQRPYPLNLLQRCEESRGFSGPYWRDRKLDFWARAAGDNGGPTNVVMRWFYPTQPGFYFPSNYFVYFPTNVTETNLPPAGTHVPWLDLRAGTPTTPHNVTYTVNWPAVHELRVAETLVKPKFGLPDISSQSSVEVIYQQSLANAQGESVKLIDPTRVVEVTNVLALPADIPIVQSGALTFFPTLPPHLRPRIWYDGITKALRYEGLFVEPPAGEYYLLLNVITERDRDVLLGLSQDPVFRGQINVLATKAAQVIEVPPNVAFDKRPGLALTAGLAEGTGYVTLAFGNSTNLTPVNEPVDLEIIRVSCPLYRGELKVIESEGPFDEKLTLRHSGDFAGRPADYIFEWRTLPPGPDGLPQTGIPREQWASYTPKPANGLGAVDITIEGPGLFTLSDNYFVCRYRPVAANHVCGPDWSEWTVPQLAPGWIKRVIGRINLFNQRAEGGGIEGAETRFAAFNKQVNTIVSMISQAGPRFEGSIPFNAAALDSFGLIEIYQTVLQRGMNLSINGVPPINYGPANDALLLAAGRLSDLYMLLGNEAYADASDPTIAYGTDSGQYGNEASSIHCFQNQTASLLDEELALLRGRDDALQPGVRTQPFYNRLVWNFTGGEGEVAFAANYDIRDASGVVDGILSEADAKKQYPQAHGDAWGHYLTAIMGYYQLFHSPYFTWVPRTEAVLVGGVPVQVDYMDERKFARAAVARAQTGAEIVGLTYRSRFTEDPAGQWQGYPDSNTNRAWGVSEWGSRAGQGAFFDWAIGNALLPPTSTNTGIQKIDRTTVTELRDLASTFVIIQEQVEKANTGLNPLGLTKNTIPFDIDPVQISQGKTHFEQIYERAVSAMNNAIAVFNHANNSSQALRRQADSIAEFQQTVVEREADFNNRLIESFGYPYPGDIGPTGTYPSGYNGPDLYHHMYVDTSAIVGQTVPTITEFTVTISDLNVTTNSALINSNRLVRFHLANNGLGLVKPSNWVQPRRAPGEVQRAHSDLLQAKARFERALQEYQNLLAQIEDQTEVLDAQFDLNAEEINILVTGQNQQESLNSAIRRSRDRQLDFQTRARTATLVANAVAESFPKVFGVIAGLAGGVIGDWTGALRSAVLTAGNVTAEGATRNANRESLVELDHQQAKELAQSQANIRLTASRQELNELHQIKQLEQLVRQEALSRLELYTMQEAMQQAAGNYAAALARGQRILEDRLRFRQQTAARTQEYRYKDMAFRIFRNDALQKYRAQFDTAAMYVHLAAKAYDFETNLRPGDPGQPGREFLTQIVRARTVGKINNGIPEVGFNGDPGLADPMARLSQNFALLKTQLGINNQQPTLREFSLRSQLLRVVPGTNSSAVWREALAGYRVANLTDIPEVRQHLLFEATQPQEPGLVIPFSSTVNQDLNFFGWPSGPGDSSFNPSVASTKLKSISASFINYRISGPGGMQASVYIYLVPVGSDTSRTPRPQPGDTINFTREWKIVDQWLPVPFPLSGRNDPALGSIEWIPINSIQLGQQPLANVRGHGSFEAWHDSQIFPITEPQFKATRLIGRSVWNDKWLLVIPGVSLFASDRNEGLNRFIHGGLVGGVRDGNGVSDIRIRMEAYSHTGR